MVFFVLRVDEDIVYMDNYTYVDELLKTMVHDS